MDYFVFEAWREYLRRHIIGMKIQSCINPWNGALVLVVSHASPGNRDHCLTFEMTGNTPGIYWSEAMPRAEKSSLLAKSFRKRIAGGRIREIRLPGLDRNMVLTATMPEWEYPREIWFEMRGNRGNLICVDTKSQRILECFSKIPDAENQPIRMPGHPFEPMYSEKTGDSILLDDISAASRTVETTESWQDLLSTIRPITPFIARRLFQLKSDDPHGTVRLLEEIRSIRMENNFAPAIVSDRNRDHLLAFIPSTCRLPVIQRFRTIDEAAGQWRMRVHEKTAFMDIQRRLNQWIGREIARIKRNMRAVSADREKLGDPEMLQRDASLLAANFARITPGLKELTVDDYFQPDCPKRTISLDPSIPARKQVDMRFRKAGKFRRSRPLIEARWKELTERHEQLKAIRESLEKAGDLETLEDIRQRIESLNLPGPRSNADNSPGIITPRVSYLRFRSSQGYTILVGRSAKDNDALTFRISKPHDFWLHAKGYRGAHVIIRNPEKRKSLPEQTIREAASLAVLYSRAKGEKNTAVLVTQRKNVRRAPGGIPGRVTTRRHATVTPEISGNHLPEGIIRES